MTPTKESTLLELAEHHARQAVTHAKAAMSNATWYHDHERDTRRAAEHFAVADALRARAKASTISGDDDHGR